MWSLVVGSWGRRWHQGEPKPLGSFLRRNEEAIVEDERKREGENELVWELREVSATIQSWSGKLEVAREGCVARESGDSAARPRGAEEDDNPDQ